MRTRWLLMASVMAIALCKGNIAYSETPDDVVEKHLAALRGRATLEKLTSRVMNGTISVSTPGGELSGSIEIDNKVPNKSRTLIKIDASQFGLGQIVQDQRFNGTSGYAIDTLNGSGEMSGDQLEIARINAFPSPLLKYKDAGSTLELLGREKANDRDAYVLRLTSKTGRAARMFIDAETFLLAKTVLTVSVPQLGGDVEQTILVSDYRDIDGVKVPYHIQSNNQFQSVSIAATKVEQNVAVDDEIFAKP